MPCLNRPVALAVALALATTITACTPAAQEKAHMEYKQNPHPTQAYTLRLRIQDAPGPFAQMKALAQYDVANGECLSPPGNNPGGHTAPVPTEDVEIPLTQVGEGEYEGTVYADRMLDEDYTGRGVCHWKLMQARVHMKATGAQAETLFIPSIPDGKLLEGETETVYFNKRSYPQADVENYPNTGLNDRARFGPSIQDDDLFTVTFTARKEATP